MVELWCWMYICHMWPLLCWGKFLDIHHVESSYHKWMLKCVKRFFCIYWENHIIFALQFVNGGVSHWLADIDAFLHPWCKSHLIIIYNHFNHYWIWFANILLRIFASMFISDIGLWFSFFVVVRLFSYQGDSGLIELVESTL